ncbi:MarR family winged helix-turn-helix transcriptional regulator [Adlercreutzia sp. R25]|uniref:MarR family winged helix-turn-helix transcriptional regulator n=1 Tax=Adlercreutzia shanghongiae TaxID=3111773 RepID=A0ABU6IZ12_9ACTN|nr:MULTISPECIES: MarR family winged helix-turn-helix transcriptional regulator [unclassified Adlercreutzia]MEC4272783.1 MarR family winged helix-turn-helix transcriptional regulator [Adlercreutzia sp. R25]MEC4295099.1 MarR family winged helix-turn-helix transcriptional regulator [Adlercreutzia sp. R22]
MTKSTELLAELKRAANYSKLAMHNEGPRSFKKGQGALLKVVYKFGDAKKGLSAKKLAHALGWHGRETMMVAKKAADSGYVTIARKPSGKHVVKITDEGARIMEKRMAAEDRAADAVFDYLTDDEKDQLAALCAKVIDCCEDMGIDYAEIEKRPKSGCGCGGRGHHRGHRFGHHHPRAQEQHIHVYHHGISGDASAVLEGKADKGEAEEPEV